MASQIVKRVLRNRSREIFSTVPNPNSTRVFPLIHRPFSSSSSLITATLFPGDGIGPEIAESVKQVWCIWPCQTSCLCARVQGVWLRCPTIRSTWIDVMICWNPKQRKSRCWITKMGRFISRDWLRGRSRALMVAYLVKKLMLLKESISAN